MSTQGMIRSRYSPRILTLGEGSIYDSRNSSGGHMERISRDKLSPLGTSRSIFYPDYALSSGVSEFLWRALNYKVKVDLNIQFSGETQIISELPFPEVVGTMSTNSSHTVSWQNNVFTYSSSGSADVDFDGNPPYNESSSYVASANITSTWPYRRAEIIGYANKRSGSTFTDHSVLRWEQPSMRKRMLGLFDRKFKGTGATEYTLTGQNIRLPFSGPVLYSNITSSGSGDELNLSTNIFVNFAITKPIAFNADNNFLSLPTYTTPILTAVSSISHPYGSHIISLSFYPIPLDTGIAELEDLWAVSGLTNSGIVIQNGLKLENLAGSIITGNTDGFPLYVYYNFPYQSENDNFSISTASATVTFISE